MTRAASLGNSATWCQVGAGSSGAGWGGKVTRISDWYLQRRHILMEPRQFNDIRTMECIVEVKDEQGLKIGQRVRVTFGK